MARKGKEQDSTVSLKSEEEWQEILNSQVDIFRMRKEHGA